jgi:hypothetical protein
MKALLAVALLALAGCAYQPLRAPASPTYWTDPVTHETKYWQGPVTGGGSSGPFDPGSRDVTYSPARASANR